MAATSTDRSGAMTETIRMEALVKTFGRIRALDGLDLEVRAGEVHGFLGPNGAGKTTAIRVLLGLLRADSGTARLLGGDPWRDAVALHRRLTGAGVRSLVSQPATLEELFLRHYERTGGRQAGDPEVAR
jgi:ABC-type multidrug transport system ATPase subunit